MKALLLSALLLSLSAGAQARSILVFRPTTLCQNASSIVQISEAADGQARLEIELKSEKFKLTAFGKKIVPPAGMAGAPLKYVGKDKETNIEAILSISVRPVKIGKVTGRSGKLVLVNRSEEALACNNIK